MRKPLTATSRTTPGKTPIKKPATTATSAKKSLGNAVGAPVPKSPLTNGTSSSHTTEIITEQIIVTDQQEQQQQSFSVIENNGINAVIDLSAD